MLLIKTITDFIDLCSVVSVDTIQRHGTTFKVTYDITIEEYNIFLLGQKFRFVQVVSSLPPY